MAEAKRERLWRKNKWTIRRCWPHMSGVIIDNGLNSYSGIIYDSGHCAFDFPERIPAYVKSAARRAMVRMKEQLDIDTDND